MGTWRQFAQKNIPEKLKPFLKVFLDRPRYVQRMLAGQELDVGEIDPLIRPSDGLILDVGAEKGEISRHFARKGFTVYAFEPSIANFSACCAFCAPDIALGRIRVIKKACSNIEGPLRLQTHGPSYGYSTTDASSAAGADADSEPIEAIRLGRWLRERGNPAVALLKVDAEGKDLAVLEGYFSEPSVPRPKVVMFEFWQGNLQPAVEFMKSQGYPHFRFVARFDEAPRQTTQVRTLITDGLHPLVLEATGGNAICSLKDFRIQHPLQN